MWIPILGQGIGIPMLRSPVLEVEVMPRLRPLSVLLLLGLMLAACSGDDHAPTSKDSSAEADVAAAADSHPPADIGDETATTDGVAGDVPADLPPPPSPWLRPWRCTAMVITTTENSHGENPLDEFALGVTEDAEGDLVLQIGHYLYETCLMTWIVDGDGATLAPLAPEPSPVMCDTRSTLHTTRPPICAACVQPCPNPC